MGKTSQSACVAALAVVVLAAGFVYFQSLSNGFVADDRYIVVENAMQSEGLSFAQLFTKPWGAGKGSDFERRMNQGYYRPIAMALIRLENAAFGVLPLGYHAVNILLHMAVCVLIFLICSKLILTEGAFVSALLFAIHPINSEVVNVVFYQTTLLAALFVFLSLWLLSTKEPGYIRRAIVVLLFIFALLCKENAIVLPLLLFLYELFFKRIPFRRALSPFYLSLAVAAGAYLALRVFILQGEGFSYFESVSVCSRVLTMLGVFFLYIKLCFWPYPLCPFYEWSILPPVKGVFDPFALAGLIVVAAYVAIAALVMRSWLKSRANLSNSSLEPQSIVGFSLCFFVVSLLPVLHFIPILNVAAERFLYLGLFAYCLMIGFWFQLMVRKFSASWFRIAAAAVLGVYLALFCALTVDRNRDWFSDESLSRATLVHFPESLNARITLTKILIDQGKYEEALYHAKIARKYAPSLKTVRELEESAYRKANQKSIPSSS